MKPLAFPKILRLPLLLGIPILPVLLALWLVQQNNVNSLDQQINALQQQIDALPATVAPKDKFALEKDRLTLEKDRVNAQNAIYGTLVQALGGVFFFVTAYFTYRNVKATEEKQVTERFSKAVELLGSEKLEVRLGAIYALERIAKDSEKDHWSIMEVLTAYVREKSSLKEDQSQPKPATDIQAIMTVLGRRTHTHEKNRDKNVDQGGQHLDLTNTFLRAMALGNSHLEGAILSGADLQGSYLSLANLKGAALVNANLQMTQMSGTNLMGAFLNMANLKGANLMGADLREVTGLTQEQVSTAVIDKNTKLPKYLQAPESGWI